MAGTISDWIIAMKKAGLEELAKKYHTEKSIDDTRLINSGLPTFDRFQVPYDQFREDNEGVIDFLAKYKQFIIRALPIKGRPNLPRRPKLDGPVYTFEDCIKYLDILFSKGRELEGKEGEYNVSLVENIPTKGSGIIMSRNQDLIIEISEENLADLSHGQGPTVWGHFANHNHHFKSMRYHTEDFQQREFIWNALQFIRKDLPTDSIFPNIKFTKGYFEFVITENNEVRFWDYKINEMYLK